MTKALRWFGYGVAGIVVLLLLAAATVWLLSERALAQRPTPQASRLAAPTAEQLADGPRMLKVNGCANCHGDDLRGKLFLDLPNVVRLYSPNLTLVAANANDAQLDQAIRQGIGHDGRALFVMPSAEYQFLTDGEVAALIAAIRDTPKGGQATPPIKVGPLGRVGIINGKLAPQPALVAEFRDKRLANLGPQYDLGQHLTQTNCTDCHGPTLAGQEISPGVVSVDLDIVGGYDRDQFRALMRRGVAPSGKDIGLMGEVARKDFRHMTDAEIDAIHAYLAARAERRTTSAGGE